MKKPNKQYKITYDLNAPEPPKPHEIYAAKILAPHFQSDIIFIRKKSSVSPDLEIVKLHQIWELKSPLGNGKRTMANNLREASDQADNVVLDLSRCKMNNDNAISRISAFLRSGDTKIKRLLVIQKDKKVLTFDVKKGRIKSG